MWNDRKSLVLSKVFVIVFVVLIAACVVIAPRLVDFVMWMSAYASETGKPLFLCTVYTGCATAVVLLAFLYILLDRIGKGRVFVEENVSCLRYISWCCFAGAAICMASAVYYVPWSAIGVAAAFMGLIVRVIKNVFAKAVSLQDDAEFTI